ncbi:MAG: YifB family Mg chelatase-like AAA ATPase [bacterium]
MLAVLKSGAIDGVQGFIVDVEVDISRGLPGFSIVGLPDNAVKESRERVKTATANSGHQFPQNKVTINLAPASIKKEGAGFDVAIAAAVMSIIYELPLENLKSYMILGELALDGTVKPVKGVLPVAITARERGMKGVIVPSENAEEAAAIDNVSVIGIEHLNDVLSVVKGEHSFFTPEKKPARKTENSINFSDVRGHEQVKRAVEIAAAGGHNVLMIGSPGSGKTMIARRIPSILPGLKREESIETTKIFSVSGLLDEKGLIKERPFRRPHHSSSYVALAGGGVPPRPGEVSLAHNGVLFLDELPEFNRNALEVLRQPMEDNTVTISRATSTVTFPSNFMLVSSMNPCPCGYLFDSKRRCTCSEKRIKKYQQKISGPLLDRIDIAVVVNSVPYKELRSGKKGENSVEIRKRVEECRYIQQKRFEGETFYTNSKMPPAEMEKHCVLENEAEKLLKNAMTKMSISTRGYSRILKVSRTIADLDKEKNIAAHHIAEAIQYYNRSMFNR